MRHALIVGRSHAVAWVLPQILARAGFTSDIITSTPLMAHCQFVRYCEVVSREHSLIPSIAKRLQHHYDWMIVVDDATLSDILASDLSLEDKLRVLPVMQEENFIHLYSKIGLSKVLSKYHIQTPEFYVAYNASEALLVAERLGYPVLSKVDASFAGLGVIEHKNPADIRAMDFRLFQRPILMQKKIMGIEVDISALYFEGKLVHFSYSKVKKVFGNKFGPSSLRDYTPLHLVDKRVFDELAALGLALGAHGFVNISCIESQDGRGLFYFEADMRPNVWTDFPGFFGDDPAIRIEQWFSHKKTLQYPAPIIPEAPSSVLMPYFLRLHPLEVLVNRYNVWKFISSGDKKLKKKLVIMHLRPWFGYHLIGLPKKVLTRNLRHKIKKACVKCWGRIRFWQPV